MVEKVQQQTNTTTANVNVNQTKTPTVPDPISPVSNNNSGMFSNLTDFSVKRTIKQAIGFYIAYLILIALSGGLIGSFIGLITRNGNFDTGLTMGTYAAVIFSVVISFAIVYKKNLLGNLLYLILVILSGILAFGGGGLFGLIPAAYLTTR